MVPPRARCIVALLAITTACSDPPTVAPSITAGLSEAIDALPWEKSRDGVPALVPRSLPLRHPLDRASGSPAAPPGTGLLRPGLTSHPPGAGRRSRRGAPGAGAVAAAHSLRRLGPVPGPAPRSGLAHLSSGLRGDGDRGRHRWRYAASGPAGAFADPGSQLAPAPPVRSSEWVAGGDRLDGRGVGERVTGRGRGPVRFGVAQLPGPIVRYSR